MGTGTSIKVSVAISALAHALAFGALLLGGFAVAGHHSREDVFFVELKEARLVAPGGERKASPVAKGAAVAKKAPRPEPERKKKEPIAPEAEKIAIAEKPAPAPVSPGEVIKSAQEDAPEDTPEEGGGEAALREGESISSAGASFASPWGFSEGVEIPVGSSGAGFGEAGLSRAEALARIRRAIERELTYPPLARRRRLEGTVLAGFAIDEGGAPRDIEIVRSSGYSVLDDEVVEIIRRAAPFPYIPERVEVPVSFRLVGAR
ncbi:MAG: energy transducer TonB [Nitrospirota bacterium]|jgi:protein TonB